MAKTTTINAATAKKIVLELEKFEELKKHLLLALPEGILPYGSKLWWEKENLEAKEDIKAGRTKKFKSADAAIKWLNS